MKTRHDNSLEPSLAGRIFGSVWMKTLVFMVLFFGIMYFVMGGTENKVQEKQLEFLADAVRRAAVQSYALEGRYPDSINYLEENYGLIIDSQNYVVYYESMGDNLLPQIWVVPLNR